MDEHHDDDFSGDSDESVGYGLQLNESLVVETTRAYTKAESDTSSSNSGLHDSEIEWCEGHIAQVTKAETFVNDMLNSGQQQFVALGLLNFFKPEDIATIKSIYMEMSKLAQADVTENANKMIGFFIDKFGLDTLDFCPKLAKQFDTVNLAFQFSDRKWDNMTTMLGNLLPMLEQITSITFIDDIKGAHLCWIFNNPAFKAALARTNVLNFRQNVFDYLRAPFFDFIFGWLQAERATNEPRLVVIQTPHVDDKHTNHHIEAIKENFMNATVPCAFAIYVQFTMEEVGFIEQLPFQLENKRTGEQMVLSCVQDESQDHEDNVFPGCFQISRHKIAEGMAFEHWRKRNEHFVWGSTWLREKLILVMNPLNRKKDGTEESVEVEMMEQ